MCISVSVTYLRYVISPIVTKVSILSNLQIWSEPKDNYYISFIMLFQTILPLYQRFSYFKSQRGFSIAGSGYTFYPVREEYFVS